MSSIFIFPGQGSQVVGMGKDLYDNHPAARAVFDEVDAALGTGHQALGSRKLSDIIFNGPMEELTMTANVQPAIMCVSIAMLRAWQAKNAFDTNRPVPSAQCPYVAGHSLGEYSALYYAGALTLSDTAKLLRLRGDAMQRAVPKGMGAMAVVMGLSVDQLRDIYSGAITNWQDVGGPDEAITAYQRPENSGSQTGMEEFVMQGTAMMDAPQLVVMTMGGLVDAIATFDGGSGSLGYSFYYYVTQMYGDLANNSQLAKIRLMQVDGVAPSPQTIQSGQYPLTTAYYIVINKAEAPDSPVRALANAMLGTTGQKAALDAG